METAAQLETVENGTTCFPPFPLRLENSAKVGRVSHSSTASTAGHSDEEKRKRLPDGLIRIE